MNLAESASNKKDWPLLRDYAMKLSELDAELGKQHLKLAMTNINIESIRTKIKEAQSAYEKKSWNETIKQCKEIHEMFQKEPELRKEFDKEVLDNILELLDKATLEETTNLHVIPKVQNETIICKIEIDGRICEYDSKQIVRNLASDENHHVRLIAVKDGIQYEWDDMVTCDWKGVKDLDVELRRSIDVLLEKAQACANENEWGKVLQACQQIFELEEGNQKVIKLREQALLATTTNAKIKAMIGEEVVDADILGLGRELKSNDIVRQLDFGRTYTMELSCMYNGHKYESSCTFTADWKGVKEFSVKMRKSVDILLEKAHELANEKAWAEAQLNCQRILELDGENNEATELKIKAELELTSNLKIKAMIDEIEVNADIDGLGHEVKSNEIIRQLEYGKEYKINIIYMNNGDKYEGFCSFIVEWRGVKEFTVKLQKSVDILLDRANKLAIDKAWGEVQKICRQILELDNDNEVAKQLSLDAEIALTSNPRLKAISEGESLSRKDIMENKIKLGNKINIQLNSKQMIQMIQVNTSLWMGKFEITQDQFECIMGYNPSINVNAQNPVESLSWEEANKFCKKLTQYCVNNKLIPYGFQFSLPTKKQWYNTLRNTCTTEIYALKITSDISHIIFYTNQICWFHENSSGRHHIVGTKSSTGRNFYDFLGNVREWCSDTNNDSRSRYCMGGDFHSSRSNIMECLTIENSGTWVNAKGGKNIGFRVALVPIK